MSDPIDATLGALLRGELPTLYLRLDREERVVELNRHTRALLHPHAEGAAFRALLTHFDAGLSPLALSRSEHPTQRVNFMTFTGLPQTLTCTFAPIADGVLVVGGVDLGEQEILSRTLLVANQTLSTRTRELQRANAELERLGALRSRFVGMAAHDLRSPLTVLILYVRMLEIDVSEGSSTGEDLAVMRSTAEFMKQIIDDFLDVSIIEAGRLELRLREASLAAIVDDAARIATPIAARKGVTMRVERSGDAALAEVDASRLQQVVMNLVNNAVEHSAPGASVWLSVGSAPGQRFIRVRDQAGGVSPALRESLFNAYVHGDAKTRGERSVGLGLAIARLIVEAHRGTIEVSPSEGGSTFTVCVPAPEVTPSRATSG